MKVKLMASVFLRCKSSRFKTANIKILATDSTYRSQLSTASHNCRPKSCLCLEFADNISIFAVLKLTSPTWNWFLPVGSSSGGEILYSPILIESRRVCLRLELDGAIYSCTLIWLKSPLLDLCRSYPLNRRNNRQTSTLRPNWWCPPVILRVGPKNKNFSVCWRFSSMYLDVIWRRIVRTKSKVQCEVHRQGLSQRNYLSFYAFTNSVGEDTMFLGCSSVVFVRPFVRPNRYCYHDISWTPWTVSIKLTVSIR